MKFWIIASSIWLYYALARQRSADLWFTTGLLGWIGAGISLFFLLGHDWGVHPVRIELINRICVWWMGLRPAIAIPMLDSNQVGGILALLLPFSILYGYTALRGGEARRLDWATILIALTPVVLMTAGLIMSGERGAWFALIAAVVIWWVERTLRVARPIFDLTLVVMSIVALLLISALIVYIAFNYYWEIARLADQLLGSPNAESRFSLFENTANLIGDFTLSGGGLTSFSGLYSQYVMVLPSFFLGYSHNLFLDVTLEQGFFGLLALLSILCGSAWLLGQSHKNGEIDSKISWLQQTIRISLGIMVLHGLFDDALYGVGGAPLLLLVPGMSVAIHGAQFERPEGGTNSGTGVGTRASGSGFSYLLPLLLLAIAGGVFLTRRDLRAAWLANLGAVQMAQAQLADYPTREWESSTDVTSLEAPRKLFTRALSYDAADPTANHRLGLIAMVERDYPVAVTYLETALANDKNNRGIIKNLGYSYTWTGDYGRALVLLEQIPEAERELKIYTWWWHSQGNDDLALKAQKMSEILEAKQSFAFSYWYSSSMWVLN